MSGPDGAPIQRHEILETSARISAVFAQARDGESNGKLSDGVAEQLPDDSLHTIQAVSFLQARQAAEAGCDAPPALTKPKPAPQPAVAAAPPQPDAEPVPAEPVHLEPPDSGCTLAFIEGDLSILGCPPDREGLPAVYELRKGDQLMRRGSWAVVLDQAKKQSGGSLGNFIVQKPWSTPRLVDHVNIREQLRGGGNQLPQIRRGWAASKRR